MSTKYLTIHCTTASNAPFIRCVIRLTQDKLNSTTLGSILRDAIAEHAPSNFTYVNNDTSIKTKGGEALPIDILNDNVGELEQLFEDGEKWFIVVSFKGDAAVAAAVVKKERTKEGASAASSGGETATASTANNNDTDNNKSINHLTIYVKADSGESVEFKVKKTMRMEKLFNAYAKSKNVEHVHELRFFMDGDRIREDDTPETLQLEDGDQIDCMLEQTGGLYV